ncbi:MAG TPA: DUF2920 family protein [Sulfurimonas sp.]|uniref:DUF2920 family protein n=1 Tax=Sulfurimonas sp. TaxID=2022749 RepID=UPI002C5CF3F0|nr:DUF2920 family protein [Sulfurimonas sp.]HUH42999.1 DUF2920 family protein [Sulfurimonas sp.]
MTKIITEEKSIVSCSDFELNIERPQKLFYKYSYPKDKKINGIVFTIQGFGAEPSYMDNLRLFLAEEFSVVAVDVYYHCFFSRPENGASLEFDNLDLYVLQDFIDKYGIDFSDVKEITTNSVLSNLNRKIGILKANGTFVSDYRLKLPITIIPKGNEYQNFGVMQAVDHINVLLELQEMPFDFIPNYSVSLMGTSHGGYLAHLIAKFAPHKIDCVIDNSCYVKPPVNYILGKETNILQPEYKTILEHIVLNCFVQTLWTTNTKSQNFFTPNHYRIRDLNDSMHTNTLSQYTQNKTRYISYHSAQDKIANIDDKIDLYKRLNNLGFETKLHIVDNQSQIDGKFIKTLSHGMDMSLKELAKKELPQALSQNKNQINNNNIIIYECDTIKYIFNYENNTLNIKVLKCTP